MSEEENKIELEEADIDTTVTEEYSAKDIQVLEGLEAVRKRPGMYIGSTGPRGLHHLVYEIVDNSIDEALAGVCTHIECNILPGNIIEVKDNGRGIPTGINEKTGLPAVTVVLTVLHAGGKFGGSGYKVSGGLHGVGSSVVNALSEWLEVEVTQNGHVYSQKFERGKPVNDLHIIADKDGHGTTIRFKADAEIFQETTVYVNGAEVASPAQVAYDTKVSVHKDGAEAWKLNDGTVVGYGDTYTFFCGSDIELTPVMTAVQQKTTVKILSATPIEGTVKVSFLATRNVAPGETVVKQGFVYGKNLADSELTLDNVGNKGADANAGTVKILYNKNSALFVLFSFFRGNRIPSAFGKWITSQNSPSRKQAPFKYTVNFDSFKRILRASRCVSATSV